MLAVESLPNQPKSGYRVPSPDPNLGNACPDWGDIDPNLGDPGCPDAPGLSSAHISTLRSHVGGSCVENRLLTYSNGRPGGGGLRGQIVEFSRASRRRLLRLLNSINREVAPLPLFITLTYPATWPPSPRTWKKHLEAFKSRLVRKYGKNPVIWRLEYQRRGAPHFHLLVFADIPLDELIPWVSVAWYEVVGSGDDRHLLAGTRCEQVRSWRGVLSYAAKYMGKLETLTNDGGNTAELPPETSAGRLWGVWYRDLVPIEIQETPISYQDAVRIRRHMARYAGIPLKRYANSSRFEVFMPHELIQRLLEYYGYYRP